MKNKKHPNYLHHFIEFAKGELEVTLAVLIVLAFVIGYTYADTAQTELVSGDVEIPQEVSVDKFSINSRQYNAIDFSTDPGIDSYRVRVGITPQNVRQTSAGVMGMAEGAIYTYTVQLDPPFTGTAFVHGEYNNSVTLGSYLLRSPAGGAYLQDATSLTLKFAGSDIVRGIYLYAGSTGISSATVQEIGSIFLIPNTVNLEVDQTRFFNVIALNPSGQSIHVNPRWTISEGTEFAKIDSNTGEITGIKPGLVTVEAIANGASASATVTIKPKANVSLILPTVETELEEVEEQSADYPGADGGTDVGTETESLLDQLADVLTPSAKTQPNTAVIDTLDLFAEKQMAERFEETGGTLPTQAEINAVIAEQPTFAGKMTVRFTAAVQEVKTTLTEIFVGRTFVSDTGKTTRVKNVFQIIGTFIGNLFGLGEGAGAAQDDIMRTGLEEETE